MNKDQQIRYAIVTKTHKDSVIRYHLIDRDNPAIDIYCGKWKECNDMKIKLENEDNG